MLAPLLAAPFVIQAHVAFAAVALLFGPVALYRKRRDMVHKVVGYTWVTSILGLSLSGLLIESGMAVIGPFGPIHILCFYALWGSAEGVLAARHGDIAKHKRIMSSVWYGAVCGAGLFTLLPGRLLNAVFFGGLPSLGFGIIGAGVIAMGLTWFRSARARRSNARSQ